MRDNSGSSGRRRGLPSTLALPLGLACALALALAAPTPALAVDSPECTTGKAPNAAVNCSDRFAWQTLVKVAQPTASHQALFETWPTDCETFPPEPDPTQCSGPHPDPKHCPVLPALKLGAAAGTAPQVKEFQPRALQSLTVLRRGAAEPALLGLPALAACDSSKSVEIVNRNPAAFNFIKDHGLWYTDGLAAAFNATVDVEFPTDAIAVKSVWRPLCPGDDPAKFQTYRDPNGTLFGLIAMHISTKDLPNWFWATFEQEDNLGRCDFLGCHDSFGVTPGQVAPRPTLNQKYPAGTLTSELLTLLKPVGTQWTHYRLKGSQIDFLNPAGQPTYLGNSVIEQGFVAGSSCITCHDRGTVNQGGVNPYPVVAGLDPDFQSYQGAPQPAWYFFGEPVRRYALPLDFLWGMAFRAAPGCQQGGTCPRSCNL